MAELARGGRLAVRTSGAVSTAQRRGPPVLAPGPRRRSINTHIPPSPAAPVRACDRPLPKLLRVLPGCCHHSQPSVAGESPHRTGTGHGWAALFSLSGRARASLPHNGGGSLRESSGVIAGGRDATWRGDKRLAGFLRGRRDRDDEGGVRFAKSAKRKLSVRDKRDRALHRHGCAHP
jgi:hypothetical protein